MLGSIHGDVAVPNRSLRDMQRGRAYIAVIGIDRYRVWNRLYNAVNDASGTLAVFSRLGFEPVGAPLFDEQATGDALHRLVTDDLTKLGENDSLVLSFAGHGHTVTRTFHGGASVKDGYLIPVDGDPPGGSAGTWMRLESWLKDVTRLPAQHILVIVDACHSGLALGPVIQWRSRGMDMQVREPLDQLRSRRSRRIITSALDDQRAMDGGPVPGHSLFTGCLIEALTGGVVAATGKSTVTGSQIGFYVQRRVIEYPNSTQTPDFGALELDDRGELVVRLAVAGADSAAITLPRRPDSHPTLPEPALPPSPAKLVVVQNSSSARWGIAIVAILAVCLGIGAFAVTSRVSASNGFEHKPPVPSDGVEPDGRVPSDTQRLIPREAVPAGLDAGSDRANSMAESSGGLDRGINTAVPARAPRRPRLADDIFEPRAVHVPLSAKDSVRFAVFENGRKLFDGPGELEVPRGETRTVVIKAEGFFGDRPSPSPAEIASKAAHASSAPAWDPRPQVCS